jgi:hypothetical protein
MSLIIFTSGWEAVHSTSYIEHTAQLYVNVHVHSMCNMNNMIIKVITLLTVYYTSWSRTLSLLYYNILLMYP